MTMIKLLALSYLSLAVGMALVTIDLRAQGLRTVAALKTHMHTFRIVTVMGGSAALLGLIGAMLVGVFALQSNPAMLLAAIPAYMAFFWGAKALSVA